MTVPKLEYERVYCQLLGKTRVTDAPVPFTTEISVWEGWCGQGPDGEYRPLMIDAFPQLCDHNWVGEFRWRRLPRNLWPTWPEQRAAT